MRSLPCTLRAWALAGLFGLSLSSNVFAQRNLTQIPPPDPELERKTFQVADGFEVNLFAADPQLDKPIAMSWDAAGRLWVVSSSVYPQIAPGQAATDRVLVLEDTDQDGRADKTTVFADGLLIPTGIEPTHNGAYVANSTELLHLVDTDGDLRADERRVVLSGFGTEDTHHIIHTFRWGPEGRLYFNQSVYIHSHVETPFGPRRLGAGGIWQLRPSTQQLEVYCRGMWNSWGHQFDPWGQSFATDGAGSEGIHFVILNAVFAAVPGTSRRFYGLNPGHPKYCALELVGGSHLPPDWQGNAITNDFRANRVCRFAITDDGAGFSAKQLPDLIRSTHVAFRPVDVKQGPDGAIYIADWYNPIIQHGEVDFRDPRRDHVHGRIWRVTAKGRPLAKRVPLVGAAPAELLRHLESTEPWVRQYAKRQLAETQDGTVLDALRAWEKGLSPRDANFEHHRLEALWVHQSFDDVAEPLLRDVLESPEPRARAAAIRVLTDWKDRLDDPLKLLAKLIRDEHPRVRLEAVRALGKFHTAEAMSLALHALDQRVDNFLDYALYLTANELAPVWLPEVQAGRLTLGEDPKHLEFALASVSSTQIVDPLLKLVQSGKLSPERQTRLLTLLAGVGGPEPLRYLFTQALAEDQTADRRLALLQALTEAATNRQVRPSGDLQGLQKFWKEQHEPLRAAALRLASVWKLESVRPALLETAQDPQTSAALRQTALVGLATLSGPLTSETFTKLSAEDRPTALRLAALTAWAQLDPPAAAPRAVALLSQWKNSADDPSELFAAFVQKKNGPPALTKALKDQRLPSEVAKIGIRVARATGREPAELLQALQAAAGLGATARVWSPAELQALSAEVLATGDPLRGETVFRRRDMNCLKCHAIGGAGGQVGPDIASLGAAAPVDYLVDSLIDPNKAIKENYNALVVATTEGKVLTGVKVRQTDRDLVLRDAEDREISIPLKSIDEQAPGKSLMPVGLTDTLTHRELVDLLRFLSQLGKVGDFSVDRRALNRRWQVLEDLEENRFPLRRMGFGTAASAEAALLWSSNYSRVSGQLPLEELPALKIFNDAPLTSFVRCQIQVTTGGRVQLQCNSPAGLQLWVDGQPAEVKATSAWNLEPGLHTLTFAIDRQARTEPLQLELIDDPQSPARARWQGGK